MSGKNRALRWAAAILLLVIPAAIYVPVRQAAVHRELLFTITRLEREILDLDEQIRMLNVDIAQMESPDRLIPLIELYANLKRSTEDTILLITEDGDTGELLDE